MWLRHFGLILLWETISIFAEDLAKICPELQTKVANGGTANVLVAFGSTMPTLQALKAQRTIGDPAERAGSVRSFLTNLANGEQADVIKIIAGMNEYSYESLWLSNRLYIPNADFEIIKQISGSPNVTHIREETKAKLFDDPDLSNVSSARVSRNTNHGLVTKGLELIKAREAWEVLGGACSAGEGVIVGVIDTGAFVEHEALKDNFVGMDYGFSNGGLDGTLEPHLLAHGTHVTGTIVGKFGIGVAPAAKHSQCRACTPPYCFETAVEKCIQFFVCPTLSDGTKPDCSKRVHVINLSIGGFLPSIRPIFDAAISAGILLVSAIGNSGHLGCGSGIYPALFPEIIAVGALELFDYLAGFSSRGPSPDGNIKPDVVAPGVSTVSAFYAHTPVKYHEMHGTSQATPHVTGLVALLLQRDKELTQEQAMKLIIENTDRTLQYNFGCGDIPRDTWPNHENGYGRINVLKTINAQTAMLQGKKK